MAKRKSGKTFIQRSRAIPSIDKARYHELDGAGKSKVKREFFGLNSDDEAAIYKRISDALDSIIASGG